MTPVVGYLGSFPGPLEGYELVPYRSGTSIDALILPEGEEPPAGLPQWVAIVRDPTLKAVRAAIKRWAFTVEEAFEVPVDGTIVTGRLANGRLWSGSLAVREGHDRSMLIREMRIDGQTIPVAEPGQRVSLAFGRVPIALFAPGTVLRPGRSTATKKAKGEVPTDLKEAILKVVGDEPAGKGTAAICKTLGKTAQELGNVFEGLKRDGRLLGFAGQWISPRGFDEGTRRFLAALDDLHAKAPQTPSHPAAKVVGIAKLSWSGKPLDRILESLANKGRIVLRDEEVRNPRFKVHLGTRQRTFLDRVIAELEKAGVNTPNAHELGKRLPAPPQAIQEALQLGEDVGEIVTLSDGVLYTERQLGEFKERIRQGSAGRPFSLGTMRDALGTSRRYAVALLEHFDEIGFTERRGDDRVVRS